MSVSLVVLCLAAAALVSLGSSALAGLIFATTRGAIAARCPAAQGRVLLALALAPAVVTITVMTAALAPSFGWIADHCASAPSHAHPHICARHESALPTLPLMALAALFLLRSCATWLRCALLSRSAAQTRRALRRQARGRSVGGARVLPTPAPQAFVLGTRHPSIFVSEGLVSGENREHLGAVLAHERAHVQRGDPMRRALARFAFAFHIPGLARALERRLALAHERAADEEAARALGSPLRVAEALVRVARATSRAPAAALAFAGSDIEVRVRALLDPGPRRSGPRPRTLGVLAVSAALAAAAGASVLHHAIETSLGLLGG